MFACQIDQGQQVVDVAMYTAVGNQPDQMQRAIIGRCFLSSFDQGSIFIKATVGNRVINPHQILTNQVAAPQCQMTNLGVAHLTIRQTAGTARRFDNGVWVMREQVMCQRVRVIFAAGVDADPVHDDQQNGITWCSS